MSNAIQNSQRTILDKWAVLKYDGIEYQCTECGRTTTFDGLPVKRRNPINEDSEDGCTICEMELVNKLMYWDGWLPPDTIMFVA